MAEKSDALAEDIAKLKEQLVIVHGGGAQATALEKLSGREPQYIYSKEGFKTRRTDKHVMDSFVMASGGGLNTRLVQILRKHGVNAAGICSGSGIVLAKRKTLISHENGKEKLIRDDYSGKIQKIDPTLLKLLLSAGYVPVIPHIGMGEEFESLNVDGDRAAAAIAGKLGAEKVVLFTDVDGYFRNFPNDLVQTAKQSDIPEFQKGASAGMKRKLVAVDEALSAGVKEVIICSGLKENPVSAALNGGGTHFTK